MKQSLLFPCVFTLLLAACAAPASTPHPADITVEPTAMPTAASAPAAAPVEKPLFEEVSCSTLIDLGLTYEYDVVCGYLSVPENHANPDSPTIRLPVAVFKSTTENPAPDPVIHLFGGPGGSLLGIARYYINAGGDQILESRDYIMFNQRGTPAAEPSLACPGFAAGQAELAEQALTQQEFEVGQVELMRDCHEELITQGVDLSSYNSVQSAADVDDLRRALGYEQINLYGVSYGTRLGLTIMRDYPDSVRSAILDGVFPPNADLYSRLQQNHIDGFNYLFEKCAADDYCAETYPDLEETFYRVIEELNTNPVPVSIQGPAPGGSSSRGYMVNVNGDMFISAIYGELQYRTGVPGAPALIYQIADGQYNVIADSIQGYFWTGTYLNYGMMYSVQCYEDAPFESKEGVQARADALPAPYTGSVYLSMAIEFDICSIWDVSDNTDPIENEAVVSAIPTLLLSGEYDPSTSTALAELAAETLSHHYLFEFPGHGHGVMRSDDCARAIGLAFLNDPSSPPDASCIDAIEILPFR